MWRKDHPLRTLNRSGFSLIELLTVIAIIALLAAIIFPVMSTARERSRQASCISNMNQIQQALKLYKQDNNRYPAVLSGYVQPGTSLDNLRTGTLFREYVSTPKTFSCPNSIVTDLSVAIPDPLAGQNLVGLDRPSGGQLYRYDSYTAQVLNFAPGNVQPRYTLAWANEVQDVPARQGNDPQIDFTRQLKFRNPPDDTVVTWCAFHRGGDQSPSRAGAIDLVLFLDGHVDRIPSGQVVNQSTDWRMPYTVRPKP